MGVSTNPGTRIQISINFVSATNASGILAAKAKTRYNIIGWNLTVPSGSIGVKFRDGTDDLCGNHETTNNAPFFDRVRLTAGVNRPLQIKVDAPVNKLEGDVWYEEEEQFTKQTSGLKKITIGPWPVP